MLTKEQFKKLYEDDLLDELDDDIDDSWRHGNNHHTVFEVLDEDTELGTGEFYSAYYRVSGDGEYNGIHENSFEIEQVEPYTETVVLTKYRKIKTN